MKKNRKAQLQMGENVIVLVIFFFLLVIAVLFYVKIQKSNLMVKATEMKKLSSIDLKTLIANAPELKCVKSGDTTDNCMDIININAMSGYWRNINSIESNQRYYYEKRFGNSKITIRQFDPKTKNWTQSFVIYSSRFNSTKSIQKMISPVTLYNPLTDDYDYGEIIIEAYYIK